MFIKYSKSYIRVENGLSYLRLNEKDHYNTGYAYGYLIAKSKNESIRFMKQLWVKLGISTIYAILKKQYNDLRIPQEYKDEIRGYADATGIPYDNLFGLNFFYDIMKRYGYHCSKIAFFNKDNVIVGRNTDMTKKLTKFALKHLRSIIVDVSIPGKRRFTHITPPLFVGAMNGFNDKGIAVNSHQVVPTHEKPYHNRLATPLLMRMMLEQSQSIKDAENIVKKNITARVLNVVVTSEKERKSITCEIHPNKINFIHNNSHNCCTIHFRSKEMHKLHHNYPKETVRMRLHASEFRLEYMNKLISSYKEMKYTDMIRVLQDTSNGTSVHHGAKSLTNDGTYESFVFDITHNILWVSNGDKAPASLTGEFVKFKVNVGK